MAIAAAARRSAAVSAALVSAFSFAALVAKTGGLRPQHDHRRHDEAAAGIGQPPGVVARQQRRPIGEGFGKAGFTREDLAGQSADHGERRADDADRAETDQRESADAARAREGLAAVRPAIEQPGAGERRERGAERDHDGFDERADIHHAGRHHMGDQAAGEDRRRHPIAAQHDDAERHAARRPHRRRRRVEHRNEEGDFGQSEIDDGDNDEFERNGRGVQNRAKRGQLLRFASSSSCHANGPRAGNSKDTQNYLFDHSLVRLRLNTAAMCRRRLSNCTEDIFRTGATIHPPRKPRRRSAAEVNSHARAVEPGYAAPCRTMFANTDTRLPPLP